MIISHLKEGLGNQFFQYAFGRFLSLSKNVELKLSTSSYTHNSFRSYKLNNFNIIENFPSLEEEKILKKRHVVERTEFIYDSQLVDSLDNDFYLEGFWQSELYFKDIRPVLVNELVIKEELDPENQKMLLQIKSTSNSVSVHVRRGDYAYNPETRKKHGVLPVSYYRNALDIMKNNYGDVRLFVFSDDIAWVKGNFFLEADFTIVDLNLGRDNHFKDIVLMSNCTHHIIANSTFSWWGAWLNTNSQKIVVAPKLWHLRKHMPVVDLYPHDWIAIDNYLQ